MKNMIALTGWEIVFGGYEGQYDILENYNVKLFFRASDGSAVEKTVPVLAKSKNYVITTEAVIKIGGLQACSLTDCSDKYLSFQEFLDEIDPEA